MISIKEVGKAKLKIKMFRIVQMIQKSSSGPCSSLTTQSDIAKYILTQRFAPIDLGLCQIDESKNKVIIVFTVYG